MSGFIDADTHVDECERTWSNMDDHDRHLAPRSIFFERDEIPPWIGPLGSARSAIGTGYDSGYYRYWFIDGQLFVRRVRNDERTATTLETRELIDVGRRIDDMDKMGVEVQVLYPTLFLNEVTRRTEIDVALCRAYNRWVAERSSSSGGRIRWVAMIPYSEVNEAVSEVAFAKEHGAVGLFKRGVECHGRSASDPQFFPVYEAAQVRGLPICFHQGSSWKPVEGVLQSVRPPTEFPLLSAFYSLIAENVPQRFPELRFGFIEGGSSWVPFLLEHSGASARGLGLADLRFYVTCEVKEDLGYLVSAAGDQNFMIGTDYGHADRAAVQEAHRLVIDRSDLTPESAQQIVSRNARSFYGI